MNAGQTEATRKLVEIVLGAYQSRRKETMIEMVSSTCDEEVYPWSSEPLRNKHYVNVLDIPLDELDNPVYLGSLQRLGEASGSLAATLIAAAPKNDGTLFLQERQPLTLNVDESEATVRISLSWRGAVGVRPLTV